MKIYSIDLDGYITGVKNVGSNCKINEYDFVGEPHFPVGHHYETGEKRPFSKEEIEQNRINELKSLIAEKQLYGEDYTKEQEELRAIKNGTHDEYLAKVKQDAVDAFTLELLESGVL